MNKCLDRLLIALYLLLGQEGILLAEEIEEVIVHGTKPFSTIELPRSITVINADDIQNIAATSLTEILAQQANISLTSFSGNSKFTSIDIRGSGDTSGSNVLVLVDGIKMNIADLSGTDFSTIPLENIERIEIIRGANSVRYGGGASHGVINIITKEIKDNYLKLAQKEASFETHSSSLNTIAVSKNQKHTLNIFAQKSNSEGYRENNDLEQGNYLLAYSLQPKINTKIRLNSSFYQDEYQLPSPATLSSLNRRNRKESELSQEGEVKDHLYQLYTIMESSNKEKNNWQTELNVSGKMRDNNYVDGSLDSKPENQRNSITFENYSGLLRTSFIPNTSFSIIIGIESTHGNYEQARDFNPVLNTFNTRNTGKLKTVSGFTLIEYKITSKVNLSTGFRQERTDLRRIINEFEEANCQIFNDPIFGPIEYDCETINLRPGFDYIWENEAYEINLTYSPNISTKLYLIYSEAYRVPNIDELALTNEDFLIPQSSKNIENGLNYSSDSLSVNFAVYYKKTKNEIIFREANNSFSGININFPEPIIRKGAELSSSIEITDAITIKTNIGYTKAETPDKKRIPLVPAVTSNIALNFYATPQLTLNINRNYKSRRLEGNDFFDTRINELPSYTVSNIKLSYQSSDNQLSISTGSNNIFNELYNSTGYGPTVYPAPERNYYGEISYRF